MALIGEMVSPSDVESAGLDQEFAPIMRRANPDGQARTVPDQHLTPITTTSPSAASVAKCAAGDGSNSGTWRRIAQ